VTTCLTGAGQYYSISDRKARDDTAVWTYEPPKTKVGEADKLMSARRLKTAQPGVRDTAPATRRSWR
jgi:uncharacterized protein (DUF427 family)